MFSVCFQRSPLMRVYKDHSIPDEVRIAAYLGIMQCANVETLASIKKTLLQETVNQGEHALNCCSVTPYQCLNCLNNQFVQEVV